MLAEQPPGTTLASAEATGLHVPATPALAAVALERLAEAEAAARDDVRTVAECREGIEESLRDLFEAVQGVSTILSNGAAESQDHEGVLAASQA